MLNTMCIEFAPFNEGGIVTSNDVLGPMLFWNICLGNAGFRLVALT